MKTPTLSIAFASALLTAACTGLLHTGDGIPSHGKPGGAAVITKPSADTAPRSWRLTVAPMGRTRGGAAWREAGIFHVLSRHRAAWDAGDAGEEAAISATSAAAGVSVSSADTGGSDGGAQLEVPSPAPLQPLPPVLSARDKLARAWKRWCDTGEGMTDEDYELVIDGEIPEALRTGCRPPK